MAIFAALIICYLLHVSKGQVVDWPIVTDPFPDIGEIGPELPPTTPPSAGCSLECMEKIDEALRQVEILQQQLRDANSTFNAKILTLEANHLALSRRVTDLEFQLPANVSVLTNKINTDVDLVRSQLSSDLASLKRDLEVRINTISSSASGSSGALEVYLNITRRINGLENGKIQHLITDNNLWRQNFRVVNATFAKLKKSAGSNQVVLTG